MNELLEKNQLIDFIINLEKGLFRNKIETYIKQGYCLRQLKDKLKNDFNIMVSNELSNCMSVKTAQQRMLLFDTSHERQVVGKTFSELNQKTCDLIKQIWFDIIGYKKQELKQQKKLTDIFIKQDSRTISRLHTDQPPHYEESLSTEGKLKENIIKHRREGFVILDGFDKVKELLIGWISQFGIWSETIGPYENVELNDVKRLVVKKNVEIRELLK